MASNRIFNCCWCFQTYNESGLLIDHLEKIHKHSKSFSCGVVKNKILCNKTFSTLFMLSAHLKTCELLQKNSEDNLSGLPKIQTQKPLEPTMSQPQKTAINFEEYMQKFNELVIDLAFRLNQMAIKHSDRERIMTLFEAIVQENNKIHENVFHDIKNEEAKIMNSKINNRVIKQIQKYRSRFKRDVLIHNSKYYIEPYELGIGVRSELNVKLDCYNSKQSTFQYVSIVETLQMLFSREEFKELYSIHNKNVLHDQTDVYTSFASGKLFKECPFFQNNQCALQLQLSVDDFEICNVLSNRSTIHKIRAIYVQIRNLPQKFLSLTDNIYLVAVAHANDQGNGTIKSVFAVESLVRTSMY